MSSAAGDGGGGSAPSPQSSSSFLQNMSSLGLGYAVGIALGSLVLFSTLLLASYVCCRAAASHRRRRRRRAARAPVGASSPTLGAVVGLPHIIFVTEDDEEEGAAERSSPAQGLDQAAINSYPKFPFSKSSKAAAAAGGDAVCPICLCEYREGEMLRVMPDCRHGFHLTCVDAWLRLNASCPVCRTSPIPTPLSVLVPLSHYAADRRRR
ncbi:hypothetical protein Taro_030807 [Colocasia esculenta]|uniref:RING-type domain-containing protein n=1 Tax=Colocasia esculenta TaxID=4460 RepID=A0A843VQ48_COLES|nr:hypothetical protein [Colocasia esculenta]